MSSEIAKFIDGICDACDGTGRCMDHAATGNMWRQARLVKGVTLRSIAREMGLSASYISDLELGRRKWSTSLCQRYAVALEVLGD